MHMLQCTCAIQCCVYIRTYVSSSSLPPTRTEDRVSHDGRPVWMRMLLTTASEWLSMVPGVRCLVSDQHTSPLPLSPAAHLFLFLFLYSTLTLSHPPLPLQSLDVLRRTADNIKDPLFRFFEREVKNLLTACVADVHM